MFPIVRVLNVPLRRSRLTVNQSIFAQSLVDQHSFGKLALMLLWTWLELLEFTVSNQTFGEYAFKICIASSMLIAVFS